MSSCPGCRHANSTLTLNGSFVDFASQWALLVDETRTPGVADVLTWNIGLRDCSDYDNCFGIAHSTGTCVCYVVASNESDNGRPP